MIIEIEPTKYNKKPMQIDVGHGVRYHGWIHFTCTTQRGAKYELSVPLLPHELPHDTRQPDWTSNIASLRKCSENPGSGVRNFKFRILEDV